MNDSLSFSEICDLVTACPGVSNAMLFHQCLMTDKRGPKEGGVEHVIFTDTRFQFRVVIYGKLRAPDQFADSTRPTLAEALEDAFNESQMKKPPKNAPRKMRRGIN